jgi:hypothetical protein
MARPAGVLLLALVLLLGGLTIVGPPSRPLRAQVTWANEPTYRYAGSYRGDWVSDDYDLSLESPAGSGILLFTARAGHLRGAVDLDVGCDGGLRLSAEGQTDVAPTFTALASTGEGLRLVEARLDQVARLALTGRLVARGAAAGESQVEAVVDQVVTKPATSASPGQTLVERRSQDGVAGSLWQFSAGEPGRLRGTWYGTIDQTIAGGAAEPAIRIGARGSWTAERQTVEWCSWTGRASARGTLTDGQAHEETLDFTFRPTGDGHVVGEGSGRATVSGGVAGGCEYSGGGVFAVRVVGDYHAGRFRVQFADDDQPQLLVTTTCPSGRYVAPQGLLTTGFSAVEVEERAGATGRVAADGAARGALELSIAPQGEIAPP